MVYTIQKVHAITFICASQHLRIISKGLLSRFLKVQKYIILPIFGVSSQKQYQRSTARLSVSQFQSISISQSFSVSHFQSVSFSLSVLVSQFQSVTVDQRSTARLSVSQFGPLVSVIFSQSVSICQFQSVSFSLLL